MKKQVELKKINIVKNLTDGNVALGRICFLIDVIICLVLFACSVEKYFIQNYVSYDLLSSILFLTALLHIIPLFNKVIFEPITCKHLFSGKLNEKTKEVFEDEEV